MLDLLHQARTYSRVLEKKKEEESPVELSAMVCHSVDRVSF